MLDEHRDMFITWTGQHAEAFRLSTSEHLRTFEGEVSLMAHPKQVSFAEDNSVLVVGTDHACVDVFDVAMGQKVQSLLYSRKSLVHYVAVSHQLLSFRSHPSLIARRRPASLPTDT